MAELSFFSIRDLFSAGRSFEIPMYQRPYEWGRDEILTLIKDINAARARGDSDYYIGSLVYAGSSTGQADDGAKGFPAKANAEVWEVVDGQQRLITLYLILCYLNNHENVDLNGLLTQGKQLTFACRFASDTMVERARQQGNCERTDDVRNGGSTKLGKDDDVQTKSMTIAYDKTIPEALSELESDLADFAEYLLDRVWILPVKLPHGTDLNSYFEIMNSRGEQLEPHEIVKARLMGKLDSCHHAKFGAIWDACSDMNGYAQTRLQGIIGDVLKYPESCEFPKRPTEGGRANDKATNGSPKKPIKEMLETECSHNGDTGDDDREEKDESDAYRPIIDFPNFLLHVLRVFVNNGDCAGKGKKRDVSLNDSRLIMEFDEVFPNERDGERDDERVRCFALTLLQCRYLFDNYVVKMTDAQGDKGTNWRLKKLVALSGEHKYDDAFDSLNKEIVLLQTMNQVTFSAQTFKEFLYEMLVELRKDPEKGIDEKGFRDFLRAMARKRLRKIFGDPDDDRQLDAKIQEVTAQGLRIPHFVFNCLDYLLWSWVKGDGDDIPGQVAGSCDNCRALRNNRDPASGYEFRYRDTIEHFYPQHPDEQVEAAVDENGDAKKVVGKEDRNRIGNLCLMYRSDNSARGNLLPEEKLNHFNSQDQSLKLQVMAWQMKQHDGRWATEAFGCHDRLVRALLRDFCSDSDVNPSSAG